MGHLVARNFLGLRPSFLAVKPAAVYGGHTSTPPHAHPALRFLRGVLHAGPSCVSRFTRPHTEPAAVAFRPARTDRHIRAFTAKNVREGFKRGRNKVLEEIDPGVGGVIAAILWLIVIVKLWILPAVKKGRNR